MKIKAKRIALLLAIVTMLSAAMPTVVAADDAGALRFGNPAGTQTLTVSPSRLLSLLLGEALTEAEADYLDRYCDRILEYSDRIPADRVRLYSESDRLQVTAYPYSYVAENGTLVTWTPAEAVYAGTLAVPFSHVGSAYEATVAGISEEDGDRIAIVYACSLEIPASVVNALSRFAYNDAVAARELPTTAEYKAARNAYLAYEKAREDYEDAQAAYDAYLLLKAQYDEEKQKYDDYLAEKAQYDEAYTRYEQYEKDKAEYDRKKAEYDRIYKESAAEAEAYRAYLNNLNRIRASTYAMESLFEKPSSGKTRELYKALQNSELVAMFERYRDELVRFYGVSDATLTHLKTTSDELNAKLGEYAKARERSEEAAFTYYKAHYHEIAHLFNYLYDNMRQIMSGMIFNHICAKMELEYSGEQLIYKKWRMKNILAHIYLICQALDDGETADGTFNFYAENGKKHTYLFTELLDQNLILTDNDAACPDNLSWMPPVDPVVLPDPPVEPTYVTRPVPPKVVIEPQAPTAVAQPTPPVAVPEVREATPTELAQYAFADRAADIVAALKHGTLAPRPAVTEAKSIALTTTLTRPISFGNGTLVTFYNADGTILDAYELSAGDAIPLPSDTPTMADAQYTYEFAGYAASPDADPSALPPLPVMPNDHLSLYAVYHKTLRRYTVTFDAANGSAPIRMDYDYGTLPTIPADPQKAMTHKTVYTFSGWSPAPRAVTGDATYVAQYLESDRLYTVTWITPNGQTVRREPYRATGLPTPPTVPATYYEGCVRYDFLGWDRAISPVTGDATYEAQYRRTVLAASDDASLTLSPTLAEYGLSGTGERANIQSLLTAACAENKRLSLTFPSLHATFDTTAVVALQSARVAYVARLSDTSGGVGLGFYAADGTPLSPSTNGIHLAIPYTAAEGAIPCVLAADTHGNRFTVPCSVKDGTLVVAATAHRTYAPAVQYPLTVRAEGGTCFAGAPHYFAGETPSLTTYPSLHHTLSAITLTNDLDGTSITLSSPADFVMPAYPATLSITFTKVVYTVTFISRDKIVSEKQYALGDTVEIPEIVTDFEEDGYRYTFIGWSSPIGTATADATYTAKFFSIPVEEIEKQGDDAAWAMGTVLLQLGLPALLTVASLAVGTVFLLRWRKKRKKLKINKKK